jgi:hypothetical protein
MSFLIWHIIGIAEHVDGTNYSNPRFSGSLSSPNTNRMHRGRVPTPFEPAVKNAVVLLKNAATFYKGAAATAQKTGLKDEATEAIVKSTLVKAFQVRSLQCPLFILCILKTTGPCPLLNSQNIH